ncbi:MAG TPA: GAF domain-containing sensor histidine kinase [Candidatus Binatia bacterium]
MVLDQTELIDGLLDLAQNLGSDAALDVRLTSLCRSAVRLAGCDRSSIYLLVGEYYEEKCHFENPSGAARGLAPQRVHIQDPLISRAVQNRSCVTVEDTERCVLTNQQAEAHAPFVVVAPVLSDAPAALGFVTAEYHQRPHAFDDTVSRLILGMATLAATAVAAERRGRQRIEAHEQEAQVDAALAKVGRELIASLNTPALLERLCQVTTEVLGCDYSCTLLWQPRDDTYVPTACHGATAEEWEAIQLVKFSHNDMADFIDRVRREEVVQVSEPPLESVPVVRLGVEYGISASLHVALRRGDEMIGFHAAGYRGRPKPFTPQQERIARGIGQLASLALETARLVEELERANRVRSEFVATMSHELRTPLNIILGYNDLLLEHAFGALTLEQADTLRRADKSARELLDLINTTLDLSRLEAGRMSLDLRETQLGDLIHEIDVETRRLQEKPGFTFVLHAPASLPPLRTDPLKLKVVLKNLIVNALKFTDQGSVMVDVFARDGGMEVCVADTGIGMTPETQLIIFEPFRQADGFKTRRQGGVGLGLYIVRRLLEMLGGTISVDSGLGRGSLFRVWIPNLAESGDEPRVTRPGDV